jgi:hypothetical protein
MLSLSWAKEGQYSKKGDSIKSLKSNLEFEKDKAEFDSMINEQTWNDLNLQKIFEKIDISNSSLGAEYLYTKMHLLKFSIDEEFEDLKIYLKDNRADRLELQYYFKKLGKKDNNAVNRIIHEKGDYGLRNLLLYGFLGGIPILSMLLILFLPVIGGLLLVFSMVFNIILSLINKYMMELEMEKMSYIIQMLYIGKKISKIHFPNQKELVDCVKNFSAVEFFSFSYFPNADVSEVAIFFEYLNYIFLLPLISCSFITNRLKKYRTECQKIYTLLGKLEAAISVTNFQEIVSYFCIPIFEERKGVIVNDMFHPLLNEPISNSIEFIDNTVLSGDNASGKSTFLRTLAINIVLAESINIALARKFELAYGNVMTTINIQDNIDSGDSYFMMESKAIKTIIKEAEKKRRSYIFLDELFRGTNALERISAGLGIMKWLGKQDCLYMISTHDIELVESSVGWNENYHFMSDWVGNQIIYNYKIMKGKAQTSNAIKILQILDYPQEIIESAINIANNYKINQKWII